jgi:Family of unknown function (DUF6188)
MYGLPDGIDFSFMIGREVIQIAIGRGQVIFGFDQNVRISAEAQFEYTTKDLTLEWSPGASHIAANTVALLGTTVEFANGSSDRTLELKFSNGSHLVLRDVNSNYESYQVMRPDQIIVV